MRFVALHNIGGHSDIHCYQKLRNKFLRSGFLDSTLNRSDINNPSISKIKFRLIILIFKRFFSVARLKVWSAFALLALLIMGPMLKPGFVLTLDMVFTPKILAPTMVDNSYLLNWLLHIINFVLPGQVIEKLIIFIILLLCGIGMYRIINTSSDWPKYFAGIFYTINPFTYERWLGGQYLLIAGYAMLPFLLKSLYSFLALPTKRTSIKLLLWLTAIAIVSIHTLVLAVLLLTIFFIASAAKPLTTISNYRRKLMGWSVAIAGSTIILNSYWLIGMLSGNSPISHTLQHITGNDINAFTTTPAAYGGVLLNVLTMYGFWLERLHRYIRPNANSIVWVIGFVMLAVLIILGFKARLRSNKNETIALGIIAIIGFTVASGVHAPFIGQLTRWLIQSVPFMKGFRDLEKFCALLVLVYAYFGAYGLQHLLEYMRNHYSNRHDLVAGFALLIPALYVSTMPFGFVNQLKPVNYPTSWYSYNSQLATQPISGKILFLPWQEYLSYDFSPRVISNPATQFFYNATIISGSNAGIGNIPDSQPTKTISVVEQDVLARTNQTNLGAVLATIQVHYVLLSNGYTYQQYNFLNRQHDLKLISNQSGLKIYQNEAYHS